MSELETFYYLISKRFRYKIKRLMKHTIGAIHVKAYFNIFGPLEHIIPYFAFSSNFTFSDHELNIKEMHYIGR